MTDFDFTPVFLYGNTAAPLDKNVIITFGLCITNLIDGVMT